MYQYPSSLLGAILVLVLLFSSLLIRVGGELGLLISLVTSALIANSTLALRSRLNWSNLIAVYGSIVLVISLLTLISRLTQFSTIIGPSIDLALVVFTFIILTQYYYDEVIHSIMSPLMPIGVLAGMILAIYLNIENSLRYIVLGVLDALSSCVVISMVDDKFMEILISLALFYTLYLQPILDLNIFGFTTLLLLHVFRNITILSGDRRTANWILLLDIALRGLVIVI
jgi:hypothetical protein